MKRFPFVHPIIFGLLFFLFIFLFGHMAEGLALVISTVDSQGMPFQLKDTTASNPDALLELMRKELRKGNTGNLGSLAQRVLIQKPDSSEAHAFVAIAYAAQEDPTKAEAALAKTRSTLSDPKLYALYAEAMILRLQKKYDAAITKSEEAIRIDATHPYPQNILGRIYFEKQNFQKALEHFQKAATLEPDFIPAYTNMGSAALLQGNLVFAERAFAKAINLDNNSFAAHYGLATLYEKNGRYDFAAQHLTASCRIQSCDAELLSRLGDLQLKGGLYPEALATGQLMKEKGILGADTIMADAALHLGKTQDAISYAAQAPHNDSAAMYVAGFATMLDGQHDKALTMMNKVLAQDNRHFGAYAAREVLEFYINGTMTMTTDASQWGQGPDRLIFYLEGNSAAFNGNPNNAMEKWAKAENIIPGFSIMGIQKDNLNAGLNRDEIKHLNLGTLFYLNNVFDAAQHEFDNALKINEKSFFAHYWSAQVYLKKNMKQQAMTAYEKSLSVAPDFFAALYALGELNFVTGKAEQAILYYKQALQIEPSQGILLRLGLYYENQKQFEEAANYYQKMITGYPDIFLGYNQLAWLYAKQGIRLNDAMDMAKKADKRQPENASILDTMGWIHYHKKEYTQAEKIFEQSLTITPGNPTILYHLGVVQQALGMKEEAKKSLRTALESKITFEEMEEAKKNLHTLEH
ncbi:MAG: tetratricopeptide repeat protein [Desulfobulbaceae bacterium]|nr:tetratricopeptide repeat protein [Desulfobulbaceae bacterium]